MPAKNNVVSCQWLLEHLHDPDLIIFDAGMAPVGSEAPYLAKLKILGAQRFDFSHHVVDTTNRLPNTMPNDEQFTALVQQMGVNTKSTLVVYDDIGVYSAPRAWWMFKVMGFDNVYVLNGGLPAWQACGGATQTHYSEAQTRGDFVGHRHAARLIGADTVLASIDDSSTLLLDARAKDRFSGEQAEPRAGMRAGHIPQSKNLPFAQLVHNGLLKPKTELASIFSQLVPQEVKTLQFSCGSGVTACILALGAAEVGYQNLAVYDGSWSEWGANPDLPIC